MNEVTIINANAAVSKFWHLLSPVIHLLQREASNHQVCRHALYVLRVGHPTNGEVVLRASIPIVDDYLLWSQCAKFFECDQEFRHYGAFVTMWTSEFGSREMLRQITQDDLLRWKGRCQPSPPSPPPQILAG